MIFLTPVIAIIAAAVAIPALVILYFLKLKRRDVEISTTLLWKKAIQDLQANAPFQRLRNNILLILQLLALLAALLALAQPELSRGIGAGDKHVI
ncbi:MAG: BatA domain-containing protein, partial [bacterium]